MTLCSRSSAFSLSEWTPKMASVRCRLPLFSLCSGSVNSPFKGRTTAAGLIGQFGDGSAIAFPPRLPSNRSRRHSRRDRCTDLGPANKSENDDPWIVEFRSFDKADLAVWSTLALASSRRQHDAFLFGQPVARGRLALDQTPDHQLLRRRVGDARLLPSAARQNSRRHSGTVSSAAIDFGVGWLASYLYRRTFGPRPRLAFIPRVASEPKRGRRAREHHGRQIRCAAQYRTFP
jgi:hypothetical protein